MIQFVQEEKTEKNLTLNDVKADQVFINGSGYLCQMISKDEIKCDYSVIADEEGNLYALTLEGIDLNKEVKKIYSDIVKVKFS